MRLLLAEDEVILSRALVAILKHNNYSVDAVFDGETAAYVFAERVPVAYHGTGDIFTSTLTAAYLRDRSLKSAAQIAANFTARCIKKALTDNREERFGVDFETQIPYLIKYLEL